MVSGAANLSPLGDQMIDDLVGNAGTAPSLLAGHRAWVLALPGVLTWALILGGYNPFLVWPLLVFLLLDSLALATAVFFIRTPVLIKIAVAFINLSLPAFSVLGV